MSEEIIGQRYFEISGGDLVDNGHLSIIYQGHKGSKRFWENLVEGTSRFTANLIGGTIGSIGMAGLITEASKAFTNELPTKGPLSALGGIAMMLGFVGGVIIANRLMYRHHINIGLVNNTQLQPNLSNL